MSLAEYTSSQASTGGFFSVPSGARISHPRATVSETAKRPRANASVENAVYAHIRAIRTLGRTTINAGEIAKSLSLPVADVNRAVAALKSKGVKVIG